MKKSILLIFTTVLLNLLFTSFCSAEKIHQSISKSTYTAELSFEQIEYYLIVEGNITGGKSCAMLNLIFEFSNRMRRNKSWMTVKIDSYNPDLKSYFEISDKVGKMHPKIQSEWYASGLTVRCPKK